MIKINGVTSSGNVVVGTFWSVAPLVVDKSNVIVSSSGDGTISPISWALISDPDMIDAPLSHQGFF